MLDGRLAVAVSVLLVTSTGLVLGPAGGEIVDPCSTVLETVGTEEEHVCYMQDVATTAPRFAHNASLHVDGDLSVITFTFEDHGNHSTFSVDQETWTKPLPTHNATKPPTPVEGNRSDVYRLAHFRTPMIETIHDRLIENDTRVHAYLSHGWYLVDATNATYELPDRPFVDQTAPFNTSAKIQKGLETLDGDLGLLVRSMPNRPGAYNESVEAIQALGGTVQHRHPGINVTEATLASDNLTDLASSPDVIRIEGGNLTVETHMDKIRKVTGAWDLDPAASGDTDGYLGSEVTAMIMDSQFDTGNDEINSSIAGYWPDKTAINEGDHGAKVFAVAHADDVNEKDYEGMAREASSVMAAAQKQYKLARYPAAAHLAAEHGGVIQATAWEAMPGIVNDILSGRYTPEQFPAWNTYNLLSMEADRVAHDLDVLPIQSMANRGPGKAASEAVAKNPVSVGGLYHHNNKNPNDDVWADPADDGQDHASTGPTYDCRMKPDIVGPYDWIETYLDADTTTTFRQTSGASSVVAGAGMLLEDMYRKGAFSDGNGYSTGGRPSASTVKALLLNTAHSHDADRVWDSSLLGERGVEDRCGPGQDEPQPRNARDVQGWGHPNLAHYEDALDDGDPIHVIDEPFSLDSGDYVEYTLTVPKNTESLNVTLTWTDPPGTPLINGLETTTMVDDPANINLAGEPVPRQLVNDLDLVVRDPDGPTYPGNHGVGNDASSDQGNRPMHADRANSAENVFVPDPTPSGSEDWTVEVHASSIQMATPSGDGYGQDFTLVIHPSGVPDSCSCDDTDQHVHPFQ